ncbi:50S ribosomal protein L29 [Candidatus Peregrinibacteria bacterium]|nr:50S ribosomal protein L29 [Candidatus Peregrinibacteria bacterium]
MNTLAELKKMTIKELEQEFDKATQDLFKIKFEVNTGASKAHHQIGQIKKYRAQILTVKNQIAAEEAKKFNAQKEVSTAEK